MELSIFQQIFVWHAERCGLPVIYDYVGRMSSGKMCPAVFVNNVHDLETGTVVCVEKHQNGYVVYAMF